MNLPVAVFVCFRLKSVSNMKGSPRIITLFFSYVVLVRRRGTPLKADVATP